MLWSDNFRWRMYINVHDFCFFWWCFRADRQGLALFQILLTGRIILSAYKSASQKFPKKRYPPFAYQRTKFERIDYLLLVLESTFCDCLRSAGNFQASLNSCFLDICLALIGFSPSSSFLSIPLPQPFPPFPSCIKLICISMNDWTTSSHNSVRLRGLRHWSERIESESEWKERIRQQRPIVQELKLVIRYVRCCLWKIEQQKPDSAIRSWDAALWTRVQSWLKRNHKDIVIVNLLQFIKTNKSNKVYKQIPRRLWRASRCWKTPLGGRILQGKGVLRGCPRLGCSTTGLGEVKGVGRTSGGDAGRWWPSIESPGCKCNLSINVLREEKNNWKLLPATWCRRGSLWAGNNLKQSKTTQYKP